MKFGLSVSEMNGCDNWSPQRDPGKETPNGMMPMQREKMDNFGEF